MAKLSTKVYNQQGKEIGNKDLNPEVFGVEISSDLVHRAVVAQMANSRYNLAYTKQRGEVRGGGKKPWRQKGTGRARHGSNRSPIWVGGAVTFGPDGKRNFSKSINKKARRKAMFMSLSDKLNEDKIVVLEKLELTEAKTKSLASVLKTLPSGESKILLVIDKNDEKVLRAARNIDNVRLIMADSLNVYDIVNARYVLITQDSLPVIDETYFVSLDKDTAKKEAKEVKKQAPTKKDKKKIVKKETKKKVTKKD